MKKKTKQTPSSLISTTTADLKTLINDHSLFFDKLVQLIPAQYYLPTDDDNKPWYQGLSKAAKASSKQQTRENIKKARRARLDPENSNKTTLDILKKNIEIDNEENVQVKSKASSSVTYEELQQRLQAKLVELRSNRGQGKRSVIDRDRKRRRDDFDHVEAVADDNVEKGEGDIAKEIEAAAEGIEFGKLRIDNEVGRIDKKRKKGSKAVELERARKLEEAKKDPEKGEVVAKQHSWKAATSRAMGIKVHDNAKVLKESIKKDKKRHEKNASKWKERVESKDKLKSEKQQKRAGNIAERAKQKKDRKIAKREKKLMRPGFEGRKQGYINGDK